MQRNDLVINVPLTADKHVFTPWVIDNAVVPTCFRGSDREADNGVLRRDVMVETNVVDNADTGSSSIGEIDGIGIAMLVRHVIDQEVVDAVVKVPVGADGMNQFVDVEVAD